jgi:hypothetical protein
MSAGMHHAGVSRFIFEVVFLRYGERVNVRAQRDGRPAGRAANIGYHSRLHAGHSDFEAVQSDPAQNFANFRGRAGFGERQFGMTVKPAPPLGKPGRQLARFFFYRFKHFSASRNRRRSERAVSGNYRHGNEYHFEQIKYAKQRQEKFQPLFERYFRDRAHYYYY